MRNRQIKTSLILSFVLACSLGETASAEWHESTAEPSLVVRAKPDVGAAKWGNVPVGGKVNVLEQVGNEESIGGNTGHWVKIQWKDKTAYAFDAFLTPVASHDAAPQAQTPEQASSLEDVLDMVYEGHDKNNCLRYHSDTPKYYYCMKVDRVDTVRANDGLRTYVLLSGEMTNGDGEGGSHVDGGLVGALVLKEGSKGMEIIAGDPAISMGAFGSGPTKWDLVKLGPSSYWGWKNTWGDTHQGITGTRYSILAPYGKKIKELAGFVQDYSDEGNCDEASGCKATSYTSHLKIDSTQIGDKVFPLNITVSGTEKGKTIPEKTWIFPFDTKTWSYVEPKGWTLENLEF
jgi:hypothetical protein